MVTKAISLAAAAEYFSSNGQSMTKAQSLEIAAAYFENQSETNNYEVVNRVAPQSVLAKTLRPYVKIPDTITKPLPEIKNIPDDKILLPPVINTPAPGYVPVIIHGTVSDIIKYVPEDNPAGRQLYQGAINEPGKTAVIGNDVNKSSPVVTTIGGDIIEDTAIETEHGDKLSIPLLLLAAVIFVLYWLFGRRR